MPEIIYNLISHSVYAVNSRNLEIFLWPLKSSHPTQNPSVIQILIPVACSARDPNYLHKHSETKDGDSLDFRGVSAIASVFKLHTDFRG